MKPASLALVLALAAGCALSPPGPPEEVAQDIVVALTSDDEDRADDLFDRLGDAERDDVYPILWEAARTRYEQGDASGSVALLEFMAEHYPEADAVRKALLYACFLQRSGLTAPDPDLMELIDEVLADLRSRSMTIPVWTELVQTQQEIDRGRLEEARAAFGRFLDGWDGEPAELWVYVEDIERWLTANT